MRQKLEKFIIAVLFAVMGTAIFIFPDAAAAGASRGLSLCGAVIIPSLLPFLVLSGTFMRCALCDTVGRWLARPTAVLFRLPGTCAAPILLSMLGGYPVGAAAVEQLLKSGQISEAQAARMLHFCVNAGPAFAVSTVGAALLSDVRLGWLLLAAHLGAAVLIGILEGLCCPRVSPKNAVRRQERPLAAAFTDAVNSSTISLLYMCGFVILFSVVLSLLDGGGIAALIERVCKTPALLSGLLEVSSGCVVLAGETAPSMFLFGFFLGFGGLSVHCQVRAILQAHPTALRRFFIFRLLHGTLGGGLAAVLYHSIPLPLQTLRPGVAQLQLFTASPMASLALLAMCICFLLNGEKKIAKSR